MTFRMLVLALLTTLGLGLASIAQEDAPVKKAIKAAEKAPAKTTKPAAAKPTTKKSDAADPTAKAPAKSAAEKAADKPEATASDVAGAKAIEARAEAFVDAYNRHDATALAALFSDEAEFLADEGDLLKGREAIETRYKERFKETPESWLMVLSTRSS